MMIVAIVGLGYVGLPLAAAFGRHLRTIGYDFAEAKIESYRAGVDPNRQLSGDELRTATRFEYTPSAGGLRRKGGARGRHRRR